MKSSRPRWHLIYLLLAAFDICTVGYGLYMNHHLVTRFNESVDQNRLWAEQLQGYTELGRAASAVDARVTFVTADFMTWESPQADLIFGESVLHLIEVDTADLVRKLASALRPGGQLVFTIPRDCFRNDVLFPSAFKPLRLLRNPRRGSLDAPGG